MEHENVVPLIKGDHKMKDFYISLGQSRFDTNWKNVTFNLQKFVTKLSQPTRTQETTEEFHALTTTEQDNIKDVGGFVGGTLKNGRRTASSLSNRTIITLDMDHIKEDVDTALGEIEEAVGSYSYVIHSTHKHRPTRPRLRLLLFFDTPAFADEYQAVSRKLAEKIGIERFDDSTYQAHRLMYWPSLPSDGQYVFVDHTVDGDGNPYPFVSKKEVLSWYGGDNEWQDTSFWPKSSREQTKFDRHLKKQADPLTKKGIIGAFCRVYGIEEVVSNFLTMVYHHDGGNRWTYIEGSSSKGLVSYDNKFAYSNHATDPISNTLVNAFDLLRIHQFGHLDEKAKDSTPIHKMPSFTAMADFSESIQAVKVELIKSVVDKFEVVTGDSGGSEDAAEDLDAWLCLLHSNKKTGEIKPTLFNAALILRNDPAWKDLIWRNDFTTFKERGREGSQWTNDDTLEVRIYIANKYKIDLTDSNVSDAIDHVAAKQNYHPVKEYLLPLKWDGVKRAETLWIDYLGEEDNPFTRESAVCWLLAAVSRIFEPGYKFDYVPVLYGAQGIRKTTFCRVMAVKTDWFGELQSVDPQKAVESMKGKWILELGELGLNNRHEIEQVKSFISGTETTVRLPYKREAGTFKRQCVFIGTTNEREYLKDSTGNRRWWPIDAREDFTERGTYIDLDKLKRNRDQIWAEVMEMYYDLDSVTELSDDAVDVANERQFEKMPMDEWLGIIESWLEQPASIYRYDSDWNPNTKEFISDGSDIEERDRVCVPEIWDDCLGMKMPLKRAQSNRIVRLMNTMPGWSKHGSNMRFKNRYGRQRGWVKDIHLNDF